jgi:mono/diheme cytochrome c family protein
MSRIILALGAAVAALACVVRPEPEGAPPPVAVAAPARAAAPAAAPTVMLAEGRRVFESVCASCHTVSPPPGKAPPMSHVARHYRQAFPAESAAVARIAAWIAAPAAERSVLPAHARERFGLMPAQALAEPERRAVAAYVLTLADSAMGGMQGMQNMQGMQGMQGMQHGQGMAGGHDMQGGAGMQCRHGQEAKPQGAQHQHGAPATP